MADFITTQDGTRLAATGQRDRFGNPIYLSPNGDLITQQNDKLILSRPGSSMSDAERSEVQNILSQAGLQDFAPLVFASRRELDALTPTTIDPRPLGDFRDEAEGRVGVFYDKDLQLLRREFEQERAFAKVNKDIGVKENLEEEQFFTGLQDRAFAKALERTNAGFVGRNTFTSGIRRGEVDEQSLEQEEFEKEELRKRQAERDAMVRQFEQFIPRSELQQERGELGIARQKEEATLRAQAALQAEDTRAQQAQTRDFTNFLADKSSA